MLRAAELASMQAVVTASLPDTLTVLRNTPVSDGQGGQVDSWQAVHTYPCRIIAPGGYPLQLKNAALSMETVTHHYVNLPYNADVRVADRFSITQVQTGQTLLYRCIDANNPSEPTCRQAVVERIL